MVSTAMSPRSPLPKPTLRLGATNLYRRYYVRRNHFKLIRSDRGADEYVATRDTEWPEECLAFAVGNSIFWRDRTLMRRVTLLRHELSHVADHRRFGGVIFAGLYWVAHAIWGYERNPFELKAIRSERIRINNKK